MIKFFSKISLLVLVAFAGANFLFIDLARANVTVVAQVDISVLPVCFDNVDNDGDGKIDYPSDPGCSSTDDTDETDPPACGDGNCDTGETCSSCPVDCGDCETGGGGVGNPSPSINIPVTTVVFNGKAQPNGLVFLLKDGQILTTIKADENAKFSITLGGLSAGNYVFSLYGQDSGGNLSGLSTFLVNVAQGVTTQVSGIYVPPTLSSNKTSYAAGEIISVFGQSAPNSTVVVSISSAAAAVEIVGTVTTDDKGKYFYNFNTATLEKGAYLIKARASIDSHATSDARAVSITVGAATAKDEQGKLRSMRADLNYDLHVNLIDFSIAAYWYHNPLNDAMKLVEKDKLNGDGVINLQDFSIMAYYWTG